jgi:hypothetical protein
LKNGIEILSRPRVKIFTACLAEWQKIRVIFIPKPGRTSYELTKLFRPISLTSFLLKTMERLVDQSIRIGPLKRFPLERSQHAYQRYGRSSETALHDLVSRIESALGHKIFALGAFLDVEGAFDNTFFGAMGKACADHKVHFTLSRWIAALLSNRTIRVEIKGVSSTMIAVHREVYCHRFCGIWLFVPCWFV